ncbi:branched-chain amino acid ABC transporter permease [Hoeflea sp. WL0058]|uniref:Branched-chain amino acid ABC transporter permease n=1 Tax=Flavimaribacter sediminis TaxID=2865987 RepID=A0AAE2ZHD2_9HYPH|nr:branched-chain amino acid ABC transporter permease [Flavimaribacter sediminis]MBW8636326.1 branched-chain amino acid ABC transporter permease [Flavimaribacter sediminis]
METSDVIQLALIGISQGCGYALVAIGFVFIYRATEIINFAHGELMMLGAFMVLTFAQIWGLNFWLSACLGILSLGVFGYLLDAVVMRRIVGESQAIIFILTVAIALMLRSLAGIIWGWSPRSLDVPFMQDVQIGGIVLGMDRIAIILGTILLCALLYWFFSRTRTGLAIQASSQSQLAAYYSRIPVKRLISVVWAIAAMVAAVAGLMMAPVTQVDTGMSAFGIKAFAGAVVGGFGSIPGALLGCLLIGLAEPFLDFFFPAFKGVYAYIIMLVVLFIRPEGLIPQTFAKKV